MSDMGMQGTLATRVTRRPKTAFSLKLPRNLGRILVTRDPGQAYRTAREVFLTELTAFHHDGDGKLKHIYDLGSGLVTNAGVNMLVNDINWIGAATPFCTLSSMNFHGIGTGATAAAATDYSLQTAIASGSLTGSTNGYFTGTQVVTAPNIYKTTATITANATLAVTEWALFMSNAAKFSGTATATSATTLTDSGASFTTSGNGLKGWTVEASSSVVNTPTTTAMLLVTSDTGTVLTGANGWFTLANASASTPSGTTGYNVLPSCWDRKVFAAINVVALDTISFAYSLTAQSGG